MHTFNLLQKQLIFIIYIGPKGPLIINFLNKLSNVINNISNIYGARLCLPFRGGACACN